MGRAVDAEPHALVVRRGRFRSRRSRSTATTSPNAAMTLAALALFADGTSRDSPTSAAGRVKVRPTAGGDADRVSAQGPAAHRRPRADDSHRQSQPARAHGAPPRIAT
jgi:hypothetical protein